MDRVSLAAALVLVLAGCLGPPGGEPQGYVVGMVTVGPLAPVEREGRPSPTPPPELCLRLVFRVLDQEGKELLRFSPGQDCRFRVALAPGKYVLEYAGPPPSFTKDLPRAVEIRAGETLELDIHVDTGIR